VVGADGKSAIETSFGAGATARSLELGAIVGATYRLGRGVTIGASIQAPTVNVFGSYDANLHMRYDGVGTASSVTTAQGSFSAPPPPRFALGVGTDQGRLKVEADVSMYAPIDTALRAEVFTQNTTVVGAEGAMGMMGMMKGAAAGQIAGSSANATFVEKSLLTIDSGVGAEYFVNKSLSVIGGFSADFSTVPTQHGPLAPTVGTYYQERQNHATVSLGIGSYGGAGDLLFGLRTSFGHGTAYAVNGFALPPTLAVVEKNSVGAIFVVAGNANLQTIERTVLRMRELVDPTNRAPTPR
jgi:hypothetical protein